MTTATDAIIKKIKALRARANDEASTEAEAAMAARIADDLLRTHNLTLTEVEARSEGVVRTYWGTSAVSRGQMKFACVKIAEATGTRTWLDRYRGIAFLGSPADVETALYFMDLVQTAIAKTWRTFARTDEGKRLSGWQGARKVGNDFRRGVAFRLSERICEAHKKDEADGGGMSNGTAVVLVKHALIEQWLDDNGMSFRKGRSSRRVGSAYGHGRDAAEGIGIGRGIGTNNRAFQLGVR